MKNKEKFILIEGHFIPQEAKEILLTVFGDKIQFHHKKNFSMQERFGKADENSLLRIPQLQKCIKEIIQLIDLAQKENKMITIESEVIISLTNPQNS